MIWSAGRRLGLRWNRWRDRPATWTAVLSIALLVAVLVALGSGATAVPWTEMPRALIDPQHPAYRVLWTVRVPRVVAGVLVGGGLATAGALLQAVVRNPLADPGLIGVTAGAGLGGLLVIIGAPQRPALVPVAALGGGLLAASTLLAIARGARRVTGPLALVLSGVAIQAALFAGIALLTFLFADRAPAFVAFAVGSLHGVGWDGVRLAAVPCGVGVGLAMLATRPLDLLLLDDDSGAGVGLSVERTRMLAAALAALLAASAVSVAGLVGFVGLVVPNWVRTVVGPAHRLVLPLGALAGAALLVSADTTARRVAAPLELPVGALMALIGAPYFLATLWRKPA